MPDAAVIRSDQRAATPEFDLTRALRQQVERHGMNPADALETLASIVEREAWEPLGFTSLREWVVAPYGDCGLGWDTVTVKKLLSFTHPRETRPEVHQRMARMKRAVIEAFVGELAERGSNQHTGGDSNTTSSNYAAGVLARLKRDGLIDLYEAVLDEAISANEAAIQAGYRKRKISVPLDPEKAASAIARHFPPEDVRRLIRLLGTSSRSA